LQPEPGENDPAAAARSAAAATITRVLEQVGILHPARIDYEAGADGAVLVRVIIEEDVSELLCTLTGEGDLISARLIEL
jgi:hypothetical protein